MRLNPFEREYVAFLGAIFNFLNSCPIGLKIGAWGIFEDDKSFVRTFKIVKNRPQARNLVWQESS